MKVSFRLDVEGKGGSLCEIVRRGEENGEERANGLKRDTWPRDKRKDVVTRIVAALGRRQTPGSRDDASSSDDSIRAAILSPR